MFHKAEKRKQKLRMAVYGPSGSGKTYTSLLLAKYIGGPIAVIDTEHGSASKYAGDVADFDVCEPNSFEPQHYIEALNEARSYNVVVIDSLSHAWIGRGGLLDQADKSGGKFNAWKGLTPQHNALIEAITSHPSHIIATMRSKTEYEVTKDSNGKSAVERLGTAAVQRDGMEYEFDVVGLMDQSNTLSVIKTRCPALNNQAIRKPGAELAATLIGWLDDGATPPPPTDWLSLIKSAADKPTLDALGKRIAEEVPQTQRASLTGPYLERMKELAA